MVDDMRTEHAKAHRAKLQALADAYRAAADHPELGEQAVVLAEQAAVWQAEADRLTEEAV